VNCVSDDIETLSEYQLRTMTDAADFKLSHKQLWDAVAAGIIPEPNAQKRWERDAFHMLLASAMLARQIPPLTHRAVVLYDAPHSHITVDAVRGAMGDVLPGIKNRDEKMVWVNARAREIEETITLPLQTPNLLVMAQVSGWLPANGRAWGDVFIPMYRTFFTMRITHWYLLATRIEEAVGVHALPIPREELRTILAVRGVHAEIALLAHFVAEGVTNVPEATKWLVEKIRTRMKGNPA